MDYNGAPRSSGRDTYMTIVLCAFVAIPVFVFLNILTGGLFLWLLIGAAGIGILGTFHYFLWGRSFAQETAGEREEEEIRAEGEAEESPYSEPDEYGRS
jgi:dipeptide/tripeptide permease